MIFIFQILVIAIAILLIFQVVGNKKNHRTKAWKKLLILLLAIFMVIAVLWPSITDKIAHFVGIGRGADLLLYLLSLTFLLFLINNYLNQQEQTDKIYRLARKIAIIEAKEKYLLSNNKKRNIK